MNKYIIVLLLIISSLSFTSFSYGQTGRGVISIQDKPNDGNTIVWDSIGKKYIPFDLNLLTNKNLTNVLYVSKDGNNDTAVKGDITKSWSEPWSAIRASSSGDIVYIFTGTYVYGDGNGTITDTSKLDIVLSSNTTDGGNDFINAIDDCNLIKSNITVFSENQVRLINDIPSLITPFFLANPQNPAENFKFLGNASYIENFGSVNDNAFRSSIHLLSDDTLSVKNLYIELDSLVSLNRSAFFGGGNFTIKINNYIQNYFGGFYWGGFGTQSPSKTIKTLDKLIINNVYKNIDTTNWTAINISNGGDDGVIMIDNYDGGTISNSDLKVDIKNIIGNGSRTISFTQGRGSYMNNSNVSINIDYQNTTSWDRFRNTTRTFGRGWITWNGGTIADANTVTKNWYNNIHCNNCIIEGPLIDGSQGFPTADTSKITMNYFNITGNYLNNSFFVNDTNFVNNSLIGENAYVGNATNNVITYFMDINYKSFGGGTLNIQPASVGNRSLGTFILKGRYELYDVTLPLLPISNLSNSNISFQNSSLISNRVSLPLIPLINNGSQINFINFSTNITSSLPTNIGVIHNVYQNSFVK